MTAAAWYITLALPVAFSLGFVVGRVMDFGQDDDDWMNLADACSDTPIADRLAYEMSLDPIDPVAAARIKGAVMDELAARRGAR